MRKKILTLLVMVMALVLSGCNDSSFMDDIKAKAMEEVARLGDEVKKSAIRAIIVAGEEIDKQREELAKTAGVVAVQATEVANIGPEAGKKVGDVVLETPVKK